MLKTLKYAFKAFSGTKNIVFSIIALCVAFILSLVAKGNIVIISRIPDILGILLAGMFAGVAIVASSFTKDIIKSFITVKDKYGKNYYKMYLETQFRDLSVLIISLMFALLVYFFMDTDIPYVRNPFEFLSKQEIFATISLFSLFLGLSAFVDICWTVYEIMKLKYDIAEDEDSDLSNK